MYWAVESRFWLISPVLPSMQTINFYFARHFIIVYLIFP